MSSEALLDVEDVHAEIQNIPVLRGVDLSVDSGESIALIGRNGAGKTTTFRVIMGLIRPTSGEVSVHGENITNVPVRRRHEYGLGFAPEDRRLFTDLSVLDNMRIAAWGTSGDVDENEFQSLVDRIMEIFPEMENFLERPASQLSGGQQKMVAVSRALAAEPDLILLDEPFEGLAPSVRERLRNGIEEIREMGVSILLAESNVRHASESAERFYVIERGEIIATLDSEEIEDSDAIARIFGSI